MLTWCVLALGSIIVWVATTATSAAANSIVYCMEASPDSFDSGQSDIAATHRAAALALYNRLIDYQPGSGNLIPGLAKHWEITPDGLHYTFHLRQGVNFHHTRWFKPTRPFNADDVIWSLERQLDADHPGASAAPSGFAGALAGGWARIIRHIEKVDPYTVKITLIKPYAPLLALLASWQTSIVSAEYGEQLTRLGKPQRIAVEPVGTGPYQLVKYVKNATIRYEAHPGYFRGEAATERLIISIIPDSTVRAQKLKSRECDLADGLKPPDLAQLEHARRVVLAHYEPQITSYLAFNTQTKPFTDARVRQALSIAINRPAIVKAVFDGRAQPGWFPYSSRHLWGAPQQDPPPRDLEKARNLLRDAGYTNGFTAILWVRAAGGPTNLNPRLTAQIIQADWKKIGVNAMIVTMDSAELLRRVRQGAHQIVLSGWQNSMDPDELYGNLLTCTAARASSSRWCDPKFDRLIDQARSASVYNTRLSLYQTAGKYFIDAMPWAVLAYPRATVAYTQGLQGVAPSPAAPFNFERLRHR